MWTEVVLVGLLGLSLSVSHSLPSPTNVSFSSVNLRNVLHWFPRNGAPDDTRFAVEYAIYGDSVPGSKGKRVNWRAVRQCTDIVRTWCDLSAETWDEEQGYHARVRAMVRKASSKWAMTQSRFDPKSDTTFGPPLVSVELEDNSAVITMKGPMRWQPNNRTPAVSMKAIYPHMSYNLSIHNTHRNQTHHFPVINSSYKYRLLEYNTEYCFSARSRFLSMPVDCQSSAWYCITTPQDPVIEQLRMVVVGIVVPALFICVFVVAGYILHVYLAGTGQKTPHMLSQYSFHRSPLAFPPDHPNLISTVVKCEPPLPDPSCPEFLLRMSDPPPSYSLQGPAVPIGPEEPSEDLSSDYGGVCIALKVNTREEEEARERRHDEGDGGNNLKGLRDAQSGGTFVSQGRCYLSQKGRPSSHMQLSANRAVSTLVQAHTWKDGTTAPPRSAQGSVTGEMENRGSSALVINRHPQTAFFNVPANLEERGPVGATMDEEEGSKCENVPLLSPYVLQNVQNMPTSHSDQSDRLENDYGLLMPTAIQETEVDDFHEMEEGSICINWDPQTRRLVLPDMKFTSEEELDGLMPSNREEKNRMLGNDKDMYVVRGQPKLESVFVRQTSEEQAQKELQAGEEARLEAEDVFTKWDLVISMAQ